MKTSSKKDAKETNSIPPAPSKPSRIITESNEKK